MKTTLAIALLAFALSFCNLMGRRSNTNTNGNSRSSGEIAESSPTSSPAEENSNRTDGCSAAYHNSKRAPNSGPSVFDAGLKSQFRRECAAASEAVTSKNNFGRRAKWQSHKQAPTRVSTNREGSRSVRHRYGTSPGR